MAVPVARREAASAAPRPGPIATADARALHVLERLGLIGRRDEGRISLPLDSKRLPEAPRGLPDEKARLVQARLVQLRPLFIRRRRLWTAPRIARFTGIFLEAKSFRYRLTLVAREVVRPQAIPVEDHRWATQRARGMFLPLVDEFLAIITITWQPARCVRASLR